MKETVKLYSPGVDSETGDAVMCEVESWEDTYVTGAWVSFEDYNKKGSPAPYKEEIGTMLWHEGADPHCCGCWNIAYTHDGLHAVCNECGKTVDLAEVLKPVGR